MKDQSGNILKDAHLDFVANTLSKNPQNALKE